VANIKFNKIKQNLSKSGVYNQWRKKLPNIQSQQNTQFCQMDEMYRRRRFWHATQDCVAQYGNIILHRGRF